jgi:cytidylate kinase
MKAPPGFIVAIDGPSGVGKTSAGMRLAGSIGAVFVDTGIFYRALTVLALRRGLPTEDGATLALATAEIKPVLADGDLCQVVGVAVEGETLSDAELHAVRTDEAVSTVAGLPAVRTALVELQRRAAEGAAVVAGRDIGTVIFPDAALKVYLDASPGARAQRRAIQQGESVVADIASSLAARDANDASRAVAPLAIAPDAVVIDTDDLGLDDVVRLLERLAQERLAVAYARG